MGCSARRILSLGVLSLGVSSLGVSSLVLLVLAGFCWLPVSAWADESAPNKIVSGDANIDGNLSLADVFALLNYLPRGQQLECFDAADVNDDGIVSDGDMWPLLVLVNRWGTTVTLPGAPYPQAGFDATEDGIDCRRGRRLLIGEGGDAEGAGGGDAEPDEAKPAADGPDEVEAKGTSEGGGVGNQLCDPVGYGSELEFIHFAPDDVPAFPGMEDIEVDIVFETVVGDVEALTLSIFAEPNYVTLESLEFTQKFLDDSFTNIGSVRTFDDPRAEGHLATSIAFDVTTGSKRLPETTLRRIASLRFSIDPNAPVGESIPILFQPYPGFDGLPEIPNEVVGGGRARIHERCGLSVRVVEPERFFVRGDADRNQRINLSDVVGILQYLFQGEAWVPPCLDAADTDDNGTVEVSDALYLTAFLFRKEAPPLPPFPLPGVDSMVPDRLDCVTTP